LEQEPQSKNASAVCVAKMLERFVIPFPKRNMESLECARVAKTMYLVVNPMDDCCLNCFWFDHGWCDNFEEEVDDEGWCEEWEEAEDDNIG